MGVRMIKASLDFLNSSMSLINKIHEKLNFAEPIARSLELSYPAQETEVSWLLSIPPGVKRKMGKRIFFDFHGIKKINLKNLPLYTESTAISYNDQGYYLDVKKLDTSEKFLLTIQYDTPQKIFKDLISIQKSATPMNYNDGVEEYWLSVVLKKRELLRQVFSGGLDIYGFENNVKINVHNSISTTIPKSFIQRLMNITNYIHETDRGKIMKIAQERIRQQKAKKKHDDERKLIMDLNDNFCTSESFLQFITVDRPFIYKEAIEGQSYSANSVPFDVFPKSMDVIVSTNINFDHPTAEGKIYFKKNNFEEALESYFEKIGYKK